MPLPVHFSRITLLLTLAVGLGLVGPAPAAAQAPDLHCLMLPVEPAVRAQQATVVVEAEVLDARSFWNAAHTRLFTRHRLRPFALLKGQPADTTGLVLITEGGRLDLDQQRLTNTLQLEAGQQGIFFLTPAPWPGLTLATGQRAFTPFASEQGFIEYNTTDGTAAEPFRTYPAINTAFYQGIAQLTGQPFRQLQANPALAAKPARRGMAPTIAGFSPASLSAGTGSVLTITGDGFGASQGTGVVEFRNADDGGATRVSARDGDYISWSNTRIQVRVPSAASGGHPAGSGPVRVTTSDQFGVETSTPLTVVYALTNVESSTGALLQRPNHIALNSTGGISFHFGPNFNTSAAAAWQRALASWRCQSGMNWDAGTASTTNTIADDGQNVVAFDQGAELPTSVLGRTTSYYKGCYAPSGEVVFWVKEIDMQFDDATTWQFGPAVAIRPQIDFESVAVHELGHAQQLTHLNLPGAIMHYAVTPGQNNRILNPLSDIAGARQVLRVRSFRNLGCGGPALLPAPLTSFGAQYVSGTGVTVSWATRDECFLSGFAVERSTGSDTTAWQLIVTSGFSPGASQNQVVDGQPLPGLHYYRLRLLRPDGSRDNVAPALVSTEGNDVSIFPNPVADDFLRLQYSAAADGVVTLRCYDALGRRVLTSALNTAAGLSILNIPLPSLRPGLYILNWQDAQGRTGTKKFFRI